MADRLGKCRDIAAKWEPSSRRRAVVVGAYSALILTACVARAPGLNPASLWFDDVWTGALMKTPGVAEMVRLETHIPSGFLVVVRLVAGLVPDQELGLQAVPFLLSLVAIPLVGRVVFSITGHHGAALAGASLTVLNPYLATYSISTKPFTADFAICCLIFLVGAEAIRHPSVATQGRLVIVGLAGFMFSYPSVIVSLAAVAVSWLSSVQELRERPRTFGGVTSLTLSFVVVLGVWFLFHVRYQLGPSIRSYWEMGYMPVSSVSVSWDFLVSNGWAAVSGAVPAGSSALAVLAIPGLAWLMAGKSRRAYGAMVLVALIGAVMASVLRLYPIGGGRTDIYSFPLTILLVACGVVAALSLVPRGRIVGCFLTAAVVAWACVFPATAVYDARVDAKQWVETLSEEIREEDGLVIHPFAGWLVACYGDWPVRFAVERRLAPGFIVEVLRPNTFSVMSEDPQPQLMEFLDRGRFERVFYLAEQVHVRPEALLMRVHRDIHETIENSGYQTTGPRSTWATELTLYGVKSEPGPGPLTPRE